MRKKIDSRLLKIVFEDILFLTSELKKDIKNESLRRISPILRRLLIQQELSQACNMLGIKARIYVPSNAERINKSNLDFEVFQSGGAVFKGMSVDNIFSKPGEYLSANSKKDREKVMDI
ncbi:MAG TPA: hypothetical protein ENL20_03530, partial [Candidatus Cloacimonetes bacterium]|nr:hypothetical protein [Candidatus Cloacimonadota bacterium]